MRRLGRRCEAVNVEEGQEGMTGRGLVEVGIILSAEAPVLEICPCQIHIWLHRRRIGFSLWLGAECTTVMPDLR